jgi:hypothetical protein
MASKNFSVNYYYVTPGAGSKTSASYSGSVASQSETLVMQLLRKKHPGKEIELREIKWK